MVSVIVVSLPSLSQASCREMIAHHTRRATRIEYLLFPFNVTGWAYVSAADRRDGGGRDRPRWELDVSSVCKYNATRLCGRIDDGGELAPTMRSLRAPIEPQFLKSSASGRHRRS